MYILLTPVYSSFLEDSGDPSNTVSVLGSVGVRRRDVSQDRERWKDYQLGSSLRTSDVSKG